MKRISNNPLYQYVYEYLSHLQFERRLAINTVKSYKYDLFLYTKGYNIETSRLNEYKKYNVDYYTSYILVIKSNGKGLIKRYEVSLFRKIRDFAFIYAYRIIKKWF